MINSRKYLPYVTLYSEIFISLLVLLYFMCKFCIAFWILLLRGVWKLCIKWSTVCGILSCLFAECFVELSKEFNIFLKNVRFLFLVFVCFTTKFNLLWARPLCWTFLNALLAQGGGSFGCIPSSPSLPRYVRFIHYFLRAYNCRICTSLTLSYSFYVI